ncbi:SDR family NAD(P)-dependent oxidoreductase [Smaragdicoccus niigatensis]|uniref:SDR family NAD(P)-dependent oxidoreductase n=1 Tax=Smaragdicoccus niigatensis TaxID=359359 RepID=UPI00037A82C7|nr:SDR family oxidoreductase [Smaragdicoccus niigatensis]
MSAFAGKTAVVTGGARGIGEAIARALAAEGAQVTVADLDGEQAAKVAAEIGGKSFGGDISSTGTLERLFELSGPVDIFVANAGIMGAPGLDAPDESWDAVLNVNVLSHVRAAKLLVPGWVERGGGYFVSVASAAGLLTQIGSATYSVSKHAAVGFAEWLSVTYGNRGVKVSCLCPMGVDTDLLRTVGSHAEGEIAYKAVATAGAILDPKDVAQKVIEGMSARKFLILPHESVLQMYQQKGVNYDGWLGAMRWYQDSLTAPTKGN